MPVEELGVLRGINQPAEISYSLLAALVRHMPLDEAIEKMCVLGVSSIHYDISDLEVTLPTTLSHDLRKDSNIKFDYHIANANPDQIVNQIKISQGDYVCVHAESSANWCDLKSRVESAGGILGIGLNVNSEISILKEFFSDAQPKFVLVMAAEAGKSGGTFDFATIQKIHSLQKLYPEIRIHVDGGIDDLAAASLRGLGVNLLVSGSYIHSSEESINRLAYLRGLPDNPRLGVLVHNRGLAIYESAPWSVVLDTIDEGGIGCCAVVSPENKLVGFISDHDIRVALYRNASKEFVARDVMNRNVFTAKPEDDFWSLMIKMQSRGAMHTVIPLVSDNGEYFGILRTQDALFSKSQR